MALSLEEFVHSLDLRTLPRVVEIQSGIYFEGSIYEMFGNECCLSTGEVIKITGLKIKKIMAEICEENSGDSESQKPFELPLNFPGLFKVMADKTPYLTMEEITRTIQIGPSRLGHPCFYHLKDIKLENLTIKHGEPIRLNSVEELDGEMLVNCGVVRDYQSHSFTLPLSQEGEFYECEDEHIYTLKEIVEWKIPKNRTRTVKLTNFSNKWDSPNPFPEGFNGTVILKPVYEIQGVLKCKYTLRKVSWVGEQHGGLCRTPQWVYKLKNGTLCCYSLSIIDSASVPKKTKDRSISRSKLSSENTDIV